jgi:large subunit ribosomal protein L15
MSQLEPHYVKAVAFSESAKAKIEAAGGKAELVPGRIKWTRAADKAAKEAALATA